MAYSESMKDVHSVSWHIDTQISHEGLLYHTGLEALCRIRPNSQKSWIGAIPPKRPDSAKTPSERGSFQRSIYLMEWNGVSLISLPLFSSCLLFSHGNVVPMIRNELRTEEVSHFGEIKMYIYR